jgi:hypothetical protein
MEKEIQAKMSQTLMKIGRGEDFEGDGDSVALHKGKKIDEEEHKITDM